MGLLLTLLTACAGGDDAETVPSTEPDPVLTFYVYAPERPMMTRGADDVSSSDKENEIQSLQIWVFETGTNNLVGYLKPDVYPAGNTTGTAAGESAGRMYQMTVSKRFAKAATRPNVDVYVMANAAAAGLSSLGESTSREELESAVMDADHFGVQSPVSRISRGLPMSGVLRNQGIIGSSPILSIGEGSTMAKLHLMRMVSKVRFVFSKKTGSETVAVSDITINGNIIPVEQYVFLTDDSYRIGNIYESTTAVLLPKTMSDVRECAVPTVYAYTGQTAQDYETLIDGGVTDGHLTQVGPFYFKETDKQVSGMITYKVGAANSQTVPFVMSVPDVSQRFVRNHSWIVYAYYNGPSTEPIINIWVDTNWQTGEHFMIED